MRKTPLTKIVNETPGNPQISLRLPAEIGMALLKDAKKQKCTVQALILGIVAEHYELEIALPGRGRPKKASE